MKASLELYEPGNNRSQLIEKNGNKIIMDAYNANPSSMQTSIKNFLSIKHPHKIAILGDMLELGADSLAEHQKIIDQLKSQNLDYILVVGSNFCKTTKGKNMNAFQDTTGLANYLKSLSLENCLCLIKGSRGMKLESLVDIL